ncbi:MAG: ankyrin repeat domain-containing protein [archaeon]
MNKNIDKSLALINYINDGDTRGVKKIVESGHDVNDRPNGMKTPIHLAIQNKNKKLVHYLLDHGAKLNDYSLEVKNWDVIDVVAGKSPFYLKQQPFIDLLEMKDKELVDKAVENGIQLNKKLQKKLKSRKEYGVLQRLQEKNMDEKKKTLKL